MVSAVFYPDMVTPIGDNAKKAYDNFYAAVKKVSEGVDITPGKLVFIDNRFTLHSRDKFKATFDSNGLGYRWLHRIFIAPKLWAFRSFTKHSERVFIPNA